MGWIPIACAAIGAWLFHVSQNDWLFWIALCTGVLSLWSYGVMHNYATEAAKQRPGYSGKFYDISESEADSVPNWLAAASMLSSVAAMFLFVIAIATNVWS